MRSAIRPHRREGQFFLAPGEVAHRRYEALRAYFVEGETAAAVADRFGYTESTVATLVRDFRGGDRAFFLDRRPGPRIAPAKMAAREEVLRLRAAGHSVTEIAAALATGPTALNPTGVWERSCATKDRAACRSGPPTSGSAPCAITRPVYGGW